MLVSGAVIYVDTIADLQALDTNALADGQQVQVKEYHAGTGVGGGGFYWTASRSKTDHDGGNVIDPTKIFPSDWSIDADLDAWFNDKNTGVGVFVRSLFGNTLTSKMFGAWCDSVKDDYRQIQALINNGLSGYMEGEVIINANSYSSETLTIPFGRDYGTIHGEGKFSKPLIVDQLVSFNIRASGILFKNFRVNARSQSEAGSIIFNDDRASAGIENADFDLFLEDCGVRDASTVINSYGRGVTIDNCSFEDCTKSLINADWPDPFTPGTEDVQTAVTGFRGFIIRDCRFHYSPLYILTNEGANRENLRGVLISGNYIDGATRYLKGPFKDVLVSGNEHIHAALDTLFLLYNGTHENVSIVDNNISARTYGPNPQSFVRFLQIAGDASDITVKSAISGFSDYFIIMDGNIAGLNVDLSGVKESQALVDGYVYLRSGSLTGFEVYGSQNSSEQVFKRAPGLAVDNASIKVPSRADGSIIHNIAANHSINSPESSGVYVGDGTGTRSFVIGYEPKYVEVYSNTGGEKSFAGSVAIGPGITKTSTGFDVDSTLNANGTVYGYVSR
jgi:hypothetical protein